MQPHCIFSSFPFLSGQLKGPEKRLADPYWSLVVPIKYKSKGLNIGCVSYQRISIQAHTVEDVLRLRCAAFAKMFKLQKWTGFWYCYQLQGSPDVLVPLMWWVCSCPSGKQWENSLVRNKILPLQHQDCSQTCFKSDGTPAVREKSRCITLAGVWWEKVTASKAGRSKTGRRNGALLEKLW